VIIGVTGLLGAGKTAWATSQVVAAAAKHGYMLASNIKLTPPDGVEFVQLPTGQDGFDLDALYELRVRAREQRTGLILLLDEVGILLPARFWASFPVPLLQFFVNSRKLHVEVWWISQDEGDVEVSLRRRTQYVFKVRRIPAPKILDPKIRRPWLLIVTQWQVGQVGKKDKRISRSLVRWRTAWESWFDTDEIVEAAERIAAPKGKARLVGRAVGETLGGWS